MKGQNTSKVNPPKLVRAPSTWRLYVIIDKQAAGSQSLAGLAQQAIQGGADVLQLRDKSAPAKALMEEAQQILPLTQAAGIALIINDRVDVACAVGADGVHVGQEDLPVAQARAILGKGKLIGKSTHSFLQALGAEAEGADYLGLGPIFPTPTKPDYGSVGTDLIQPLAAKVHIPFVCIGGIDLENINEVLSAGAKCVAVVRAICHAQDPEGATRQLKQRLIQSAATFSI